MFPLTRPYRQALATVAMFILTAVPTGYVLFTAWRINRPGHVRDVEVELGRQLGLQVTLESVRYPRPGEVVYRGIVLRQEEPRRKGLTEIARASLLRLHGTDRELTIEVDGLRLRGDSPRLAVAQLGAWLQRSAGSAVEQINLTAPSCELDLGDDTLRFPLHELAGTIKLDRTAPTVHLSYRLAEKGTTARCELLVKRDRKSDPVQTSLVLKTMEGLPLPARVLDVFFDSAGWLGRSARLDGELALSQADGKDWEATFQGHLLDVDLNTLLGNRFPSHHLAGRARLALQTARWADRPGQGFGWVEARGELTTGQGTIGLDLLQALASEMKFKLSPKLTGAASGQREVNFQTLGLRFDMNREGELHFDGALGNEFAPGVVIASLNTPLMYAPQGTANVRGLIKTLIPVSPADASVLVPLTAESRVLLSLPVPPELASKRIEGN
jgi:hypothetical protein